jgi:hypothetical protein
MQRAARIAVIGGGIALTGLCTIVFGVPQSSGPSRQFCGVVRTRDGYVGRPANSAKLA